MSANQVANINEQAVLLAVTTSGQNLALSFTPQNVVINNHTTGVVYLRAAASPTPAITVPTAGVQGSWCAVLPGASATYKWASTFSTQNLQYIGEVAGNISVKLTRGV